MVVPRDSHGVGATFTFCNDFEFNCVIYSGHHAMSVWRMIIDDGNTNRLRHLAPLETSVTSLSEVLFSPNLLRARRYCLDWLFAAIDTMPHSKNMGWYKGTAPA